MLALALAFAVSAPVDWVPARWPSSDPATLELVKATPVNCLLLDRNQWSAAFAVEAGKSGIATLGVVRSGDDWRPAVAAKLTGIVLDGVFADATREEIRSAKLAYVNLGPRTRMRLDSSDAIVGTSQGVWPGINATDDGAAKAAPSGAPWIDTNSGFLRFARSVSKGSIWIAYAPPKNQVIPVARYLQAIGDASMVGARWVITLDANFQTRLLSREAAALKDWKKMVETVAFYEAHKEWRALEPYGQLAVVQDAASGGLITGGILDMITVQHTPVRPVPARLLTDAKMEGAKLAVDVDPTALGSDQKETLRRFTRGGGTLLTAPAGWKFPEQRENQITLDKAEIEKLDTIWKEVNSMTGRRNLGARLFNVSSMLSNLVGPLSGKPLVLQLVNYSDYTVENVTVHVLGKYTKALIYEPGGGPPRKLATYDNEEGTGVDIDKVSSVGTLVLE